MKEDSSILALLLEQCKHVLEKRRQEERAIFWSNPQRPGAMWLQQSGFVTDLG